MLAVVTAIQRLISTMLHGCEHAVRSGFYLCDFFKNPRADGCCNEDAYDEPTCQFFHGLGFGYDPNYFVNQLFLLLRSGLLHAGFKAGVQMVF